MMVFSLSAGMAKVLFFELITNPSHTVSQSGGESLADCFEMPSLASSSSKALADSWLRLSRAASDSPFFLFQLPETSDQLLQVMKKTNAIEELVLEGVGIKVHLLSQLVVNCKIRRSRKR